MRSFGYVPVFEKSDNSLSENAAGDPPLLLAEAPNNRLELVPTRVAQANDTSINMDDLGFSKTDTTGDEKFQRTLNKRTKMLKIHQILGLTTAVAMAVALSSAGGAGGGSDQASKDSREKHEALGITTGVLYFTTAGFSIFAPHVEGEKKSGRTKIHKWLAFIHFPAMVGTMILGMQDKKKLDNGEQPSGLKPAFATTAAVAFYTSLAIMVIPFGGKGDGQ